jgi:hypothetical protein
VVEAKDIIPILVIGGLAYLALRGRAEEAPPEEEKPPIPQPGPPGLPILAPPPREIVPPPRIPYPIEFLLSPLPREEIVLPPPYPPILAPPLPSEVEEAMKPITSEVERLAEETRRKLEEARRVIEESRREAEEFTAIVQLAQAPPPPPQYIPPPQYPVEPTPPALEEFERALREYAREEWERVENALRQYGGYAVIFKTEPPSDRIDMFMRMLTNININTRGVCVYGGGYRWYDYIQAYVYDVKASWSPSMIPECKRLIRGAIESAFGGYYTEVREY